MAQSSITTSSLYFGLYRRRDWNCPPIVRPTELTKLEKQKKGSNTLHPMRARECDIPSEYRRNDPVGFCSGAIL